MTKQWPLHSELMLAMRIQELGIQLKNGDDIGRSQRSAH